MEEVVSRSQLDCSLSETTSSPLSPEHDQFKNLSGLDLIPKQMTAPTIETTEAEADEMEFRLFAVQANDQRGSTQNVRIRSVSPEEREPGFVKATRPMSYYFADTSTEERTRKSAVSDADIHCLAKIRWHGMAYSWRVLSLPSSVSYLKRMSTSASRLLSIDGAPKRRRPGKKLRIKLRTRLSETRAKEAAAKAAQESKDAAQREKRTRRNREKKVKKRLKDKAKKADALLQDQRGSGEDSIK